MMMMNVLTVRGVEISYGICCGRTETWIRPGVGGDVACGGCTATGRGCSGGCAVEEGG